MGSTGTDPTTAIIPFPLGNAAKFDRKIFPLTYFQDGNDLSKGCLLIQATLDEMKKIKELGVDLNQNEDFIFNTRINLEVLNAKKEKIQDNQKTLNPFKAFRNYRAARLFHAASKALFLETKRTSEMIHRVVPNTQLQTVDGDDAVPYYGEISGVAVSLPDGWNDDAKQTINEAREVINATDPFKNKFVSQLRDGEHAITLANTESILSQDEDISNFGVDGGSQRSDASNDPRQAHATSPQTIIHIHHYQNSLVATNSNLDAVTYSHGSRNSGASVTQEFAS